MKTKVLLGLYFFALAIAGFFVAQEFRARSWEARWDGFLTRWKAEGEIFDPEKLIPPDMGEDSDFARHPLIRRIAEGELGVLETLEKMKPDRVEGYQDWESNADESGVHPPMPPELARSIANHSAKFSVELEAFAEAARRPKCRLVADGRTMTDDMAWCIWVARLSSMGKLLGASANAAIALDDKPSLTHHLETLLLTGNLLRSSNLSLGVVVGAGFEDRAYELVRSMPDVTTWPQSDRRRWLAALDLRTRPLAEEFAETSRLERNLFLKQMDALTANPSASLTGGLTDHGPFRRIFLSRAKLAACEDLQGMVLSDAGHLSKVIESSRIARFQNRLKDLRDAPRSSKYNLHRAESFGLLPQFAIIGIQDALIQLEADRDIVREQIRRSLP